MTHEIVPAEAMSLDVVRDKMPKFLDLLQTDGAEAMEQIVDRTLAAESLDAALAQSKPVGGRELVGRPLTIRGVRLQESDYPSGPAVYAVIDAVDEKSGEVVVVTSGALRVLAALYKAHELDAFPFRARFMEPEKPSRNGFKALWLESPE